MPPESDTGENLRYLREYVLRECKGDWNQLATVPAVAVKGLTLEAAVELFCGLLSLPMGRPDDGLGQRIEEGLRNFAQTSDFAERYQHLGLIALTVERYLKRVLALCDEKRWQALHQPPPDWRGTSYNPTLADLCGPKGFDFRSGPDLVARASSNMRDLRNKFAHGGREGTELSLSHREMYEGAYHCLLVMLWATCKYKPQIEHLVFIQSRRSYLEEVQKKWQAHLQRWILLEAGELQTDVLELTAGEEIFQDLEEGAEDDEPAEETDDVADETVSDEATLRAARRGRVHDLFRDVGRLVLVASAGAGKTTSLRHYAYLEANGLLNTQKLGPVPLYVELRYYQGDLYQQLAEAARIPLDQLRRELAEGKWCLLLDGLNEVHSERLEEACRELEKLLQEFSTTPVVITSRPDTWLTRFQLPIFRLDLLTDEQIREFIRKHFSNVSEADTFTRTLRRYKALWEWGRNPLQLWMLVQVGLRAQGGLPENRGQLLRAFVNYILKREESKGPQTNRHVKEDLLTELAYQTRQAGQVSFPYERGLRILRQRCQDMGYQVDTAEFLREVCDNHLLVEQGDQLAFAHEMYQEYFAALGLKKQYEQNRETLEPLKNLPQWREPIVLLYGLLVSAADLFRQVVRDAPQLAAECVNSAAVPNQEQVQQLRQRIAQVDYERATDEELARVLEAIYVLGDGQALATHLLNLERFRLLRGIGARISSAFTGEESAAEATLLALERLGPKARNFSLVVLAPFLAQPVKISKPLRERAAKLGQKWLEYQFAPIHLLALARAYNLPDLTSCAMRKLIEMNRVDLALTYIRQFGLGEQYPPGRVIDQLLAFGRVNEALTHIRQFGLREQYPPGPLIDQLLASGRVDKALEHIGQFGLQEQYAGRVIEQLLASGRVDKALEHIGQFGLQEQYAGRVIEQLLASGRVEEALTHIRQFGLREQYPPGPLIEQLLASGRVKEALKHIGRFGLREQYPPGPLIEQLLASGRVEKALKYIGQFGLREQYPPGRVIDQLLAFGRVNEALKRIKQFRLREQYPPGPLIEQLLASGRVEEALKHIRQFGMQEQYAGRVIEQLLASGRLKEALEHIREFGMQEQYAGRVIEQLLASGRVSEALNYVEQFGLQEQYPPARIYALLMQQGHRKTAANYASRVISQELRLGGNRAVVTPLLEQLGFSSDQVEHNLRFISRIEQINTSLADLRQLPRGETLADIELFGWVKDEASFLVPGFRDFRLQPGESVKAGQVVRFRLCVCKHPKKNKLVLNAVDARPA